MFSVIPFLVYHANGLITCQSFRCLRSDLGNGKCNIDCNNIYCNYDTSLTRDFKENPSNDFAFSDCYNLCLKTGCDPTKLGNSKCDSKCNNYKCAWDLSDCGVCSRSCTDQMINNNVCDSVCDTSFCLFDNYYCKSLCGNQRCIKERLISPICHPSCSNRECLKLFPEASCFTQCAAGCYFFIQGDGLCHQECNNEDCNFDLGDCDCSTGCNDKVLAEDSCKSDDPCDNEFCWFKLGKCGDCSSGCFTSMLGNFICDEKCNVEACGFDHGDCGCSPGCTLKFLNGEWTGIEENRGNVKCLVPSCFYNLLQDEDSFLVKQIILSQLWENQLNLTEPKKLTRECPEDKLRRIDEGSEVCNNFHDCFSEEGLWCFGLFQISDGCFRNSPTNCLVCSGVMTMGKCENQLSECPNGMIAHSGLSQLFSNSHSTWCLLDPSLYHRSNLLIFYVKSSDPPKAQGNGSESSPFESLYYAFSQIYGLQTKISLSAGSHIYMKSVKNILSLRKSYLEPLNYSYGVVINKLIIEGESYKNPSVIYWKGSVSISSSAKEIYIKNIEIKGDKIIRDDCDGTIDLCYYCPFYDPYLNQDDMGKKVPDDMKTFYIDNDCSPYKNDELFRFQGKVSIENVTFINIRHQLKSLFTVEGSLNFSSVNFLKIQPSALGFVIQVSCISQCQDDKFSTKNSVVEDFNYGFTDKEGMISGIFMKISGILDETCNS